MKRECKTEAKAEIKEEIIDDDDDGVWLEVKTEVMAMPVETYEVPPPPIETIEIDPDDGHDGNKEVTHRYLPRSLNEHLLVVFETMLARRLIQTRHQHNQVIGADQVHD